MSVESISDNITENVTENINQDKINIITEIELLGNEWSVIDQEILQYKDGLMSILIILVNLSKI